MKFVNSIENKELADLKGDFITEIVKLLWFSTIMLSMRSIS